LPVHSGAIARRRAHAAVAPSARTVAHEHFASASGSRSSRRASRPKTRLGSPWPCGAPSAVVAVSERDRRPGTRTRPRRDRRLLASSHGSADAERLSEIVKKALDQARRGDEIAAAGAGLSAALVAVTNGAKPAKALEDMARAVKEAIPSKATATDDEV